MMSRRLPLASLLFVTAWAPAQARARPVEIVFASGPDETGTVGRIVEDFNRAHEGRVRVRWRTMSDRNDAHQDQLSKALAGEGERIHVFASDVVWTAQMAKSGRVEDLTDRFYRAYEREALLSAAMDSATYRLRIWGVPWYTDAGMLFYRKDKLDDAGFDQPPKTWTELSRMSQTIQKKTNTPYGYVFQGAEYEGGTVNAAEFIWSAGGELMSTELTVTGLVVTRPAETDAVRIRSPEAAAGLDMARRLVEDGVVPSAVVRFRERDALEAFMAGNAVFLRSWPYTYGVLRDAKMIDRVGVAPLPAAGAGPGSSCLGGWNLMIAASASATEKDAAWAFIRYLTDGAQQARQAREAGLLPVRLELYADSALVRDVPVMGLGRQVFEENLHARPETPYYGEMSARIARVFRRVLQGELNGTEAVEVLDRELRAIAIRN